MKSLIEKFLKSAVGGKGETMFFPINIGKGQSPAGTVPEKFKSSFKAWIMVVAFVVVAVFLPEQVVQAQTEGIEDYANWESGGVGVDVDVVDTGWANDLDVSLLDTSLNYNPPTPTYSFYDNNVNSGFSTAPYSLGVAPLTVPTDLSMSALHPEPFFSNVNYGASVSNYTLGAVSLDVTGINSIGPINTTVSTIPSPNYTVQKIEHDFGANPELAMAPNLPDTLRTYNDGSGYLLSPQGRFLTNAPVGGGFVYDPQYHRTWVSRVKNDNLEVATVDPNTGQIGQFDTVWPIPNSHGQTQGWIITNDIPISNAAVKTLASQHRPELADGISEDRIPISSIILPNIQTSRASATSGSEWDPKQAPHRITGGTATTADGRQTAFAVIPTGVAGQPLPDGKVAVAIPTETITPSSDFNSQNGRSATIKNNNGETLVISVNPNGGLSGIRFNPQGEIIDQGSLAIRGRGSNPITRTWDWIMGVFGQGNSDQLYIDGTGLSNYYLSPKQQSIVETTFGLDRIKNYDISWGTGLTSGSAGQVFDREGYFTFVDKGEQAKLLTIDLSKVVWQSGDGIISIMNYQPSSKDASLQDGVTTFADGGKGQLWFSPEDGPIVLKSKYGDSGVFAIGEKSPDTMGWQLKGNWGIHREDGNQPLKLLETTRNSTLVVSRGGYLSFNSPLGNQVDKE